MYRPCVQDRTDKGGVDHETAHQKLRGGGDFQTPEEETGNILNVCVCVCERESVCVCVFVCVIIRM